MYPKYDESASTSPIHVDVNEIFEQNLFMEGLTEDQRNQVAAMLQFAWNRGYKKGYTAGFEA